MALLLIRTLGYTILYHVWVFLKNNERGKGRILLPVNHREIIRLVLGYRQRTATYN